MYTLLLAIQIHQVLVKLEQSINIINLNYHFKQLVENSIKDVGTPQAGEMVLDTIYKRDETEKKAGDFQNKQHKLCKGVQELTHERENVCKDKVSKQDNLKGRREH